MKKTISKRTVNRIMNAILLLIIISRLVYFALLFYGIWLYIAGRINLACLILGAAAVSGGILDPALAGACKAGLKDINKQLDEQRDAAADRLQTKK